METVIKWAGGKRQLLPQLIEKMPTHFNKYVEPFIGSGALFFSVEPHKAIIGDTNKELINLYLAIRDNADSLIDMLETIQTKYNGLSNIDLKSEFYYGKRNDFNAAIQLPEYNILDVAAIFIFLNKACFNGLYRVNRAGQFNVPFGQHSKLNLVNKENIQKMATLLKQTDILCGDYTESCKDIDAGDFVYFDSPYYDTFDTYQPGGFSEEEHIRLARYFTNLTDRGVNCMLSNSNTDFIKNLYNGYKVETVKVRRYINRDANNRYGEEIIIRNY